MSAVISEETLQRHVMTGIDWMEKAALQIVFQFFQLGLALEEVQYQMTFVFRNMEME